VGMLGAGFQQGVAFKSRFDHHQFEFDDMDRKEVQKRFSYGFGAKFDSSHQVIFFPFWLAVLGSFALGWVSWARLSNSHSLQFSLRTMLIATTLVAVVLGLGVWLAS
jgi:hypothetical protein